MEVGDGESDQALDGTPLVGVGVGDGIIMPTGTIHGILGIIHGDMAGVEDTVGAGDTAGAEDTVGAVGTIGAAGIKGVGVVGMAGVETLLFGFTTNRGIVQGLEGIDSIKSM